jgi:hypothetical protein
VIGYTNYKIARSMPSIIDNNVLSRRDSQVSIEEGEGKVVGNRLFVVLEKNKVKIKSIH